MAKKLADLQLIYGVAGAREKFEELASQLIKGEEPDADKVRIVQGDGGIDIHVGDLTSLDGIDVYQCKYFIQGLGDSQKEQIRRSFRAAENNRSIKMRRWVLCLPIDLSAAEKTWFEEWRSGKSVLVDDVWGAFKLEQLLYLDKNKGLREAFFKEEYYTQIREIYRMLIGLMPELAGRLSDESKVRDEERRQKQRAQDDQYVHGILTALRDVFGSLVKEHLDGRVDPIQPWQRRPPYLEFVIRPSSIPTDAVIDSINACRGMISRCQVGPDPQAIPDTRYSQLSVGQEFLEGRMNNWSQECWQLSQRGVFAIILTTNDTPQSQHQIPCIYVSDFVVRLTQFFRLAKRFANALECPGPFKLQVRLAQIGKRSLHFDEMIMRMEYTTKSDELTVDCEYTRPDLENADTLAIKAALWFCERFNAQYVDQKYLVRMQRRAGQD